MADEQEKITIEIDDKPAKKGLDSVNEGIAGFESNSAKVMDNVGRQWNVYGDLVVRTSDKSRASVQRMLDSIARQSAILDKSGIDKILAEQEVFNKRWAKVPEVIAENNKLVEKRIAILKTAADAEGQVTSSVDRHVQSLERRAALYGKTGEERLVAEMELDIKACNGAKEAIDQVTAAYTKMREVERQQSGNSSGSDEAAFIAGLRKQAMMYRATGEEKLLAQQTLMLEQYAGQDVKQDAIRQYFGEMINKERELAAATNDTSSAQARSIEALERRAALAGKTGEDKIYAESELLIKSLGDQKEAIDRVRLATEQLIKGERVAAEMQSKLATDRSLDELQRKSALYGKSGADRVYAERDLFVGGLDPKDTERVAQATQYFERIAQAERDAAAASKELKLDRNIEALERQSALFGKSGVEKYTAELKIWEKQLEGQPEKLDKVRNALSHMIEVEKQAAISGSPLKSVEDLSADLERKTALYGKSGVDKLRAERDLLLKQYEKEPKAIEAITNAYKKLIETEEHLGKHSGNFKTLFLGAKDMYEGRGTYAQIEGINFVASLSGTAKVAGIAAAAVIGVGVAGMESAKHLAEYAEQMENAHLRTGIAVKDLEQFQYVAKASGQDLSIFERMMRGLSEAANENSKSGDTARATMKRLGIDLRDLNTGELKSTPELLSQISTALNKIPEGVERDAASYELFKRAGVEAIPVITTFNERMERAKKLGLGVPDQQIKEWLTYKEHINDVSAVWDHLKHQLMTPLAGAIVVTLKYGSKVIDKASDLEGIVAGDMLAIKNLITGQGPKAVEKQAQIDKTQTEEYKKKVQARKETDAKIRAYQAELEKDPSYQLRRAEERFNKLPAPEVNVTSPMELREYEDAKAEVDKWKKLVEDKNKYKAELSKLESFETRMYEKPMEPAAKLFDERDNLVKGGMDWDRATAAALVGADAVLRKEEDEWRKKWDKTVLEGQGEINKIQDRAFAENERKATEFTHRWFTDFQRTMGAVQELDRQNFGRMETTTEHQSRMVGIISRPGYEIETLNMQLDMRRRVREEELKIKELHVGMYDMDKERYEAEMENLRDRYDMEEQIAALKRRQEEGVQQTTQQLIHTLFSKPEDFGKQISETLKNAALKPFEEGMSQSIAGIITPIIYGKDGRSGIFGGLKSVFNPNTSEKDVLRISTDLNTEITKQNTAAINNLTEAYTALGMRTAAGATGTMPLFDKAVSGIEGTPVGTLTAKVAEKFKSVGGFTPVEWPQEAANESVEPQAVTDAKKNGLTLSQQIDTVWDQAQAQAMPKSLNMLRPPVPPPLPGTMGRWSPLGVAEYVVDKAHANQYFQSDAQWARTTADATFFRPDSYDNPQAQAHERIHQAQYNLKLPTVEQVTKALAPAFSNEKQASEYVMSKSDGGYKTVGAIEAPAYLFSELGKATEQKGRSQAYSNYIDLLRTLNPGKDIGVEAAVPKELELAYLKARKGANTETKTAEVAKPVLEDSKYQMTLPQAIARYEGYGQSDDNLPTRNNNPGDMKYGDWARKYGATKDENSPFAVFPNAEAGWAAMEDKLNSSAYSGKSLQDIIEKWNGKDEVNNPLYTAAVSKWTGMSPSSIVEQVPTSTNVTINAPSPIEKMMSQMVQTVSTPPQAQLADLSALSAQSMVSMPDVLGDFQSLVNANQNVTKPDAIYDLVSGTQASVNQSEDVSLGIQGLAIPVIKPPGLGKSVLNSVLASVQSNMSGSGEGGEDSAGGLRGMLQGIMGGNRGQATGAPVGGTPPFVGNGGAGGSGGLGSIFSKQGLSQSWGNLRDFVGLGKGGQDLGNGKGVVDVLKNGTTADKFTAIGKSPAMMAAGMAIAMHGLTGENAGTWKGAFQGAAGGAMIGFKFGGPMGAAIGAAVGFGIGVTEKLLGVESPTRKAIRKIKEAYGVTVDKNVGNQVAQIAKQSYANNMDMAVRSPEVRQMVMLYSQATGQKDIMSSTVPRAGAVSNVNGRMMQDATYVNGKAYTYQSGLPVDGGFNTGNYPSPTSFSPTHVTLQVDGGSAASFMNGQIAQVVNPGYVQDQFSSASNMSYGRVQNSAMLQRPGLVIS